MRNSCTVSVWRCWTFALSFESIKYHLVHTHNPSSVSSANKFLLLCSSRPWVLHIIHSCAEGRIIIFHMGLSVIFSTLYQSSPQAMNFFSFISYKMMAFVNHTLETRN